MDEYLYRKVIPLTHDQYLDEDPAAIEWLLRIDSEFRRAERRAAKHG